MPQASNHWIQFVLGRDYLDRVHRPLQCLIFILPLLLFYQIGSDIPSWFSAEDPAPTHIIALVLLRKFSGLFGVASNYLPFLTVIAILLFWHMVAKDKWTLDPRLYPGMAGESLLWAIPVAVLGLGCFRHTAASSATWINALAGDSSPLWQRYLVISVGAGVYEELLFRLIAITCLNIILVDLLKLRLPVAVPIIVVVAAACYALHYHLAGEPFGMGVLLFRTALGIYLGGLFIYRGFGIAVGSHVTYSVIVSLVLLRTHT